MGGHYPSFDYDEVLRQIPGLDSIVRFEGEVTLVELLDSLRRGEDWRHVHGIAFRNGDKIVANPLRAPVPDLDMLPLPYRDDISYRSQLPAMASILGSRGCSWQCSFCSIRPFYEASGGSLRRFRSPDAIVKEMMDLHFHRGVRIFLFQDDDFLAGGRSGRAWAMEVADRLISSGLSERIAFKISCRSDEVDHERFRKLKEAGLAHVYMGVESGDEVGLLNMNKHLRPEQHIEAGRALRALGLTFDFGFMLLDPYSTLESARNNIDFLETFVGDGWSVALFCKMLPYTGTPIKARLEQEGRLLGTASRPTYRFLDPRLDIYYDWVLRTFYERNFSNTGLGAVLRYRLFEAYLRIPGSRVCGRHKQAYLRHLTRVCNQIAFYILRQGLDFVQSTALTELKDIPAFLSQLTALEHAEESRIFRELAILDRHLSDEYTAGMSTQPQPLLGGFKNAWTLADTIDDFGERGRPGTEAPTISKDKRSA